MAEHFSAAGYRTLAVVANGFLSSQMGFAQGFEQLENPFVPAMGATFVMDMPLGRLLLALFPLENWADFRAEGVSGQALAWLANRTEVPLILWVHYIDPHSPYQADLRSLDLTPMMQ